MFSSMDGFIAPHELDSEKRLSWDSKNKTYNISEFDV